MDTDVVASLPFGDLLRRYRAAAALTQEELAERAGLSVRGIGDLERGVKVRPHRDTVQLLAAALGLSPMERATLQAAARRAPSSAGATPAPAAHTNLPVQLSSFVGRQREMHAIRQRLERARLLTLIGAGGTGKTRLALELAASVLDRYTHGVWLAELAPVASAALVPHAVATALGVREGTGRPLLDTLLDAVRPRHLLLVLDNCEHLLDACAALAEALLRAGPRLQILTTSREALGSSGEMVWQVPALSLPADTPPPTPELLRHSEAVQLFVERAGAMQPQFTLTGANAPAVIQVCRRLDGIPLALELAAARLAGLSVEQLATRLDQRFELLTGGRRTAPPRQQTLRATVDWSYALLSAPEQALFTRLCVFVGGFTLEAAEAVCAGGPLASEAVLALLLRLVERSLVLADGEGSGDTRYRLLETLRQYGYERLTEVGEAPMLQARHAAHYLALAERAEPDLRGPALTATLATLDAEYANLTAALEWSLPAETGTPRASDGADADDADTGLRLAGALWWFWMLRGHRRAGLRWLERALARSAGAAASARARALLSAGYLTMLLGDRGRAQAMIEESVAMYREVGDAGRLAYALTFLGFITRGTEVGFDRGYQGDYARGTALLEEGLALARTHGDPWLVMWALLVLAASTDVHQEVERARGRAAVQEGLRLARTRGSAFDVGVLQRTLGGIALYEGDARHARAAVAAELAAARSQGDTAALAAALTTWGDIAHAAGELGEAAAGYEESLALYQALDFDREWLARVLHRLGAVALDQGDVGLARRHLRASLLLARDLAERGEPQISAALEGLAGVAAAHGQSARALRLAGAASAWRTRLRQPPWPHEAAALRRWLAPARQGLSADAAAAAWSAGQAWPPDQAVAYALEEVESA